MISDICDFLSRFNKNNLIKLGSIKCLLQINKKCWETAFIHIEIHLFSFIHSPKEFILIHKSYPLCALGVHRLVILKSLQEYQSFVMRYE